MKLYFWNVDLIEQYKVSLRRMLDAILENNHIEMTPFFDKIIYQLRVMLLKLDIITHLTFNPNARGSHRILSADLACK